MTVKVASNDQCPECLAIFAGGVTAKIKETEVSVKFCPLCKGYAQRTVITPTLAFPHVEILAIGARTNG